MPPKLRLCRLRPPSNSSWDPLPCPTKMGTPDTDPSPLWKGQLTGCMPPCNFLRPCAGGNEVMCQGHCSASQDRSARRTSTHHNTQQHSTTKVARRGTTEHSAGSTLQRDTPQHSAPLQLQCSGAEVRDLHSFRCTQALILRLRSSSIQCLMFFFPGRPLLGPMLGPWLGPRCFGVLLRGPARDDTVSQNICSPWWSITCAPT